MTVMYICREDNTIADALLRLPSNCFPDKMSQPLTTVLSVMTDLPIREKIKMGYLMDEFCKLVATTGIKGWSTNGLWYINDQSLTLHVSHVCQIAVTGLELAYASPSMCQCRGCKQTSTVRCTHCKSEYCALQCQKQYVHGDLIEQYISDHLPVTGRTTNWFVG